MCYIGRCPLFTGCTALHERCYDAIHTRDRTTPCPLRDWTLQPVWWSLQPVDRASPSRCTCMRAIAMMKSRFSLGRTPPTRTPVYCPLDTLPFNPLHLPNRLFGRLEGDACRSIGKDTHSLPQLHPMHFAQNPQLPQLQTPVNSHTRR